MARLGVSKKKKSPRGTELSQLKKEVQRLTEELESCKRGGNSKRGRGGQNGKRATRIDILGVLSPVRRPKIQAVLDVVAEHAVKLCDVSDCVIV